jgi:MreB/Mbl protein
VRVFTSRATVDGGQPVRRHLPVLWRPLRVPRFKAGSPGAGAEAHGIARALGGRGDEVVVRVHPSAPRLGPAPTASASDRTEGRIKGVRRRSGPRKRGGCRPAAASGVEGRSASSIFGSRLSRSRSGTARPVGPARPVASPTARGGRSRRPAPRPARKVELIEEPLAGAVGAGDRGGGQVVVDVGGETSEVAVLTLGAMAVSGVGQGRAL